MKDRASMDRRPDSVVWIDKRRAIVAQLDPAGGISTVEIRRLGQPQSRFLGQVVHEIGAHEHVAVIGAQPLRVALERRFVAVGHRPDRLVAAPTGARAATPAEVTQLVESLAA